MTTDGGAPDAARRLVVEEASRVSLRVALGRWLGRALFAGVALLPCIWFAGFIVAGNIDDDVGHAARWGLVATSIGTSLVVLITCALAPGRAAPAVFDLTTRSLTRKRETLSFDEIAKLSVSEAPLRPPELVATARSGRQLVVLRGFTPAELRAMPGLLAWLTARTGIAHVPPAPARDPLGFDDRTAALLCYLPAQGVFLIASLYYLRAHDRPFVRFAALQCLRHTLLTIVVLVLVLGGLGPPTAYFAETSLGPVFAVLLALALVAFAVWNFTAHVVACARAYRGVAWEMPWLRWWMKDVPR